jgi:hypothetical protein
MLLPTHYTVPGSTLQEAIAQSSSGEFKYVLNQPTGDFFYDPWEIKSEFKGTVWERLLDTLPEHKGEARIITLSPGASYMCHADADDRWHLTLQAECAFLCNLDTLYMHPLSSDCVWYTMNASFRHTAANFGSIDRIQLVVRKLMNRVTLLDPVSVRIVLRHQVLDFRYQFDNTISTWLNLSQKNGIISNFKFTKGEVSFKVERSSLMTLRELVPAIFEVVEE